MKNCPKCGKELKDTARFCGGCGAKLEVAVPEASHQGNACQKCGNPLKPGAKFCVKCGAKQESAAPAQQPVATHLQTEATVPDMRTIGSFIQWNILPGQLAVKIDENDISKYGKVQAIKGVSIQAGLKALLLVSGKVVAQLDAGSYAFKDFGAGEFKPATVQTTEAAASVPCPSCGEALRPGAKFCPKCGNRLDGTADSTKAAETKEQAKGFLGRLFSAVGGAVVGIWNRITGREATQQAAAAGLTTRIPASVPPVAFVLIRATEFPLVFDFKGANTANIRSDVGLHLLCKINNINDFYANMLLDRKMVTFENLAQTLAPLFQNEVNLSLGGTSPEAVANNGALQEQVLPRLQALMPGVYPFISVVRILNLSAAQADLDNLRKLNEELYVSEQELVQAMKRNDFLNRLQTVRNEQELREMRAGNAHRNEVQAIRNEQEEYELRTGNAHQNTMQGMRNEQELTELRMGNEQDITRSQMEADFEKSKERIYEEMALTQDERAKFDLMLQAQRQLREAKSQEEVEVAMQAFEKSGLLRQQEMDNLRHQLAQDRRLRDLNDTQVLALATMNNQHTLEQQQMEWETLMGRKRLQDAQDTQRMKEDFARESQEKQDDFELARQRKQDEFLDARRDKEEVHSDARREADAQFSDNRRNADAQFEDGRRRSQIDLNAEERRTNIGLDAEERRTNIDLNNQEQMNKLDAMSRLEEMRRVREEAEHKRNMEAASAARQFNLDDKRLDMQGEQARMAAEALREKQRLDAETAKTSIYAGMSVEQIMAANPNLTEQAARALEAKFNNTAALEAEKAKAQMAQETADKMNAFLQQQMSQQMQTLGQTDQQRREDTQRMQEMMMQMMQMNNQQNATQMQMMRDMGVAQAGGTQSFQQQLMDAKQQEIDHTRADSAASSDRFVDGMKTTINAVGNMNPTQFVPVQPAYVPPQPAAPQRKYTEPAPQAAQQPAVAKTVPAPAANVCPKCGAKLEPGAMFCQECGEALG